MKEQTSWMEHNNQQLSSSIEWLHYQLNWLINEQNGENENVVEAPEVNNTPQNEKHTAAINLLASALSLSDFEKNILLLCTAIELNAETSLLCAKAQGDFNKNYPTFSLAFALFDNPDWSVMSPHAPLRYWRLLEINQPGVQPLTTAALAADERIMNYIKGLNYIDDRLTNLMQPLNSFVSKVEVNGQVLNEQLPPSQQEKVEQVIFQLKQSNFSGKPPAIELVGSDSATKKMIATHVAGQLGLNLQYLPLKSLNMQPGDFQTFMRLWQRESILIPLALYIDIENANEESQSYINRFINGNNGVLFLSTDKKTISSEDSRFSIDIKKATPDEQQTLWTGLLNSVDIVYPTRLAEQFSFTQYQIAHIINDVLESKLNEEFAASEESIEQLLWEKCRLKARSGMEKLAHRIHVKSNWEQLVLPVEQKTLLEQIKGQVFYRNRVYKDWGFREQMNRGLGINALFSGESGTGKSMAAEVIANALNLDLYRIDLSSVVSKYIGETEKNLCKLFDAAEDSGAILFFDEADALFGKRSEVKDSHDRYANIEINYLLQRMESYRGLAILATNMKAALDKAFVRRLRFIIDFPFPGVEERKAIWQKVFPEKTPLNKCFDYERLAKLKLTGGNIHSIALNSAFIAAQKGSVVTMSIVLGAAREEYKKLELPCKESDFFWNGQL
ncbi:ATP-binding protein [Aliikangiella sp. IMCC44359]|uniref:ATP-binding protein n=1 Tax=Aliikangiella sp. IMCC44359 TaxID=3459125 RepID=UPI00403AA9A4